MQHIQTMHQTSKTAVNLIKSVSIILLAIPTLLLITYQPAPNQKQSSPIYSHQYQHISKPSLANFQVQNLLLGLHRPGKISKLTNQLIVQLQGAIQNNKLIVNQDSQVKDCPRFVRLADNKNANAEISIDKGSQFCNREIQHMPSHIYINLLFTHSIDDALREDIANLEDKLNRHLRHHGQYQYIQSIVLNGQHLLQSTLPQHLRDKMHEQDQLRTYIRIIRKQLSSMRFGQHCRYTNKKCINYIVVVTQDRELELEGMTGGYFRLGQTVFIQHKLYKRGVMDLVTIGSTSLQNYRRIMQIMTMQSMVKQLRYLEKLGDQDYMVIPDLNKLTAHCEDVMSYVQSLNFLNRNRTEFEYDDADVRLEYSKITKEVLTDRQLVTINLFPVQYKIGIYLPLVLIFIIFPCLNVCRL